MKLKRVIVYLCILALTVWLTANISTNQYKAKYRQQIVNGCINLLTETQDVLMAMKETGSRVELRSLALNCASFGGNFANPLLGYGSQGGWDMYARTFLEMSDRSGGFTEDEMNFINKAYNLNNSLLSALTARDSFSEKELSNLISEFEYNLRKICP